MRTVQKFLVTRYLRGVSWLWGIIPESLRSLPVFVRYGVHLHSLTLRFVDRRQNHSTFFFRNRAELELIRRLADRASPGSSIDIAVFACSKGAEVYSIAWVLKSARPDLRINLKGIDISRDILEFASRGEYSLQDRDNHGGALELGAKTYRDQPPRMRVAVDMKWKPVTELIEEVHDGDPSIRDGWPFDYWAKEPLDAGRSDAMIRYAPAFQAA